MSRRLTLIDSVDRTWKIYIGGKQRRSDSQHCYTVASSTGQILGQAPDCNRKDVRDAVEAANLAQPGWAKAVPFLKSQVVANYEFLLTIVRFYITLLKTCNAVSMNLQKDLCQ